MIILVAKIICIGSLVGMGVIVLNNTSALRKLPAPKTKKQRKYLSKGFKLAKKGSKVFWIGLVNIKNKATEVKVKEKKPELSDDYWEKVRKG